MSAVLGAGAAAEGNAGVIGELLAELDALGVREYCVCAGARNAPLLEVLTRRTPAITIRNFYEERSAAFFALGRAMQTREPVAVVTTSGTAVAELFPAVMEAYYQALPLVLVTADRPSRYRGSGAPQAVEQKGIFGQYVAREVEIEAGAAVQDSHGGIWKDGPVHFNVCLEEGVDDSGLVPAQQATRHALPRRRSTTEATEVQLRDWEDFWSAKGDLIVLASGIHPDDVPDARKFLLKLGAPVIAEFTSNLYPDEALEPLLIRGGEHVLKQSRVQRVLRIGAVPSWRWWRDLDERTDVRVLNVTRSPFRGLARANGVAVVPWHLMEQVKTGLPASDGPAVVPQRERLTALLTQSPHSEPGWIQSLSRAIPAGATVFLGNSLPIREWNLAADLPQAGTRFFANRGANGIDGLVSTWLGVAAEAKESWLILGDLSALYDLGGPWILSQLPKSKRRIVVINNGGGKIFSRLSWLQEAGEETKRLMRNPHALGFEPWARMWGLDYRLLTDLEQLHDDDASCAIWEVRPDEAQTEAFWKAWQN